MERGLSLGRGASAGNKRARSVYWNQQSLFGGDRVWTDQVCSNGHPFPYDLRDRLTTKREREREHNRYSPGIARTEEHKRTWSRKRHAIADNVTFEMKPPTGFFYLSAEFLVFFQYSTSSIIRAIA